MYFLLSRFSARNQRRAWGIDPIVDFLVESSPVLLQFLSLQFLQLKTIDHTHVVVVVVGC